MKLWIVGRVRNPENLKEWEFMGVFASYDQADQACTDYYDFIGPAVLNQRLQDEPREWPECIYPRANETNTNEG